MNISSRNTLKINNIQKMTWETFAYTKYSNNISKYVMLKYSFTNNPPIPVQSVIHEVKRLGTVNPAHYYNAEVLSTSRATVTVGQQSPQLMHQIAIFKTVDRSQSHKTILDYPRTTLEIIKKGGSWETRYIPLDSNSLFNGMSHCYANDESYCEIKVSKLALIKELSTAVQDIFARKYMPEAIKYCSENPSNWLLEREVEEHVYTYVPMILLENFHKNQVFHVTNTLEEVKKLMLAYENWQRFRSKDTVVPFTGQTFESITEQINPLKTKVKSLLEMELPTSGSSDLLNYSGRSSGPGNTSGLLKVSTEAIVEQKRSSNVDLNELQKEKLEVYLKQLNKLDEGEKLIFFVNNMGW